MNRENNTDFDKVIERRIADNARIRLEYPEENDGHKHVYEHRPY